MGRIFPFEEPLGSVPFHNRTQKLALGAERFRSIPFGSRTEHTLSHYVVRVWCSNWWRDSQDINLGAGPLITKVHEGNRYRLAIVCLGDHAAYICDHASYVNIIGRGMLDVSMIVVPERGVI